MVTLTWYKVRTYWNSHVSNYTARYPFITSKKPSLRTQYAVIRQLFCDHVTHHLVLCRANKINNEKGFKGGIAQCIKCDQISCKNHTFNKGVNTDEGQFVCFYCRN